jgi:hypothetical protein
LSQSQRRLAEGEMEVGMGRVVGMGLVEKVGERTGEGGRGMEGGLGGWGEEAWQGKLGRRWHRRWSAVVLCCW